MPTNEMINTQLDPGNLTYAVNNLQGVMNILTAFVHNLTAEERQRYGSINEQNKLLVGKVLEYSTNHPALASPDVNWPLFNQHWNSRTGFARIEEMCKQIIEMCSDPRMLHDYSLYQNSLVDYDYTKYRANSTTGGGQYSTKMEAIKQFFPNTGGSNSSETPPPTE